MKKKSKFINNTGYKSGGPTESNPFNIIPSGNITMKNVDYPIFGIDDLGNIKVMTPGNDYQFPGNSVLEFPLKSIDKSQKGGSINNTVYVDNKNDPRYISYIDSLAAHNKSMSIVKRYRDMYGNNGNEVVIGPPRAFTKPIMTEGEAWAEAAKRRKKGDSEEDIYLAPVFSNQGLYKNWPAPKYLGIRFPAQKDGNGIGINPIYHYYDAPVQTVKIRNNNNNNNNTVTKTETPIRESTTIENIPELSISSLSGMPQGKLLKWSNTLNKGVFPTYDSNNKLEGMWDTDINGQTYFYPVSDRTDESIPKGLPSNTIIRSYPSLDISDIEELKKGGIHIKPENKGKFTEWAKRHGMGVQEAARHVLANKDKYSSTIVKRANFAKNASKWKKQDGGYLTRLPSLGPLPLLEKVDNNISSVDSEELNLKKATKKVKDFYRQYISSPNYKQKLIGQGYENPNQVIKDRLNNLNKIPIVTNSSGKGSYYDYNGSVQLDLKDLTINPSVESLLAHELSHGTGSMLSDKVSKNLRINNSESSNLTKRNKLGNINSTNWKNGSELHDSLPYELKADLDTLRYYLKRDKIFDSGNQEFNQDYLNKAKKQYKSKDTIQRLLKNVKSDEDLIWLMNNLAINNDSSILDTANRGGIINSIGDELDLTSEQIEYYKSLGYEFDII